jgi:hypothetical protein
VLSATYKEGLCVLLSVQMWLRLLCYHYHISRFCCNRFKIEQNDSQGDSIRVLSATFCINLTLSNFSVISVKWYSSKSVTAETRYVIVSLLNSLLMFIYVLGLLYFIPGIFLLIVHLFVFFDNVILESLRIPRMFNATFCINLTLNSFSVISVKWYSRKSVTAETRYVIVIT